MARGRVPALFAVVLLLATACTGGGEEEEGSRSSLAEVNRPIVAIVPAASIDEDGQPVDPTLVFAPDAPRITVVARAGEVSGSPMDITWFQVAVDGDQELFTHTVEVGSFDAAYSVGENPGTLTPGTYRVEATLEGESLITQFDVTGSEQTGAAGEGATSGPPSPGDSGAIAPPTEPDEPQPSADCIWPQLDHEPVDPDAATIGLFILAGCGTATLEAQATMGGNTRSQSFSIDATADLFRGYLVFNPCAHPGGSDLPGTRAEFEITYNDESGREEAVVFFTRLGADTSRPAVTLNAEPPSGSQVEPGDEIFFDVTAQEARSGLTWQTGVRDLRVKAIPGEDLVPQERADSATAQPCDRKQWSLVTQGSYEVPEDAPATFRICPIADDFAGNQNADTCAVYHTGEVWEGTYTGTVTDECQGDERTWSLEGEFTITVAGDVATMDIVHTVTGSCLGPDVGSVTAPLTATGERTPTGFEFASFGALFGGTGSLIITVSGDRGTGTILITDAEVAMIELTAEITPA